MAGVGAECYSSQVADMPEALVDDNWLAFELDERGTPSYS